MLILAVVTRSFDEAAARWARNFRGLLVLLSGRSRVNTPCMSAKLDDQPRTSSLLSRVGPTGGPLAVVS